MRHIVPPVPAVESGKALVYRLRGSTAASRAAEAMNGVPTIGPPYTDKQLCELYRVTRANLKAARAAEQQKHSNGNGAAQAQRDLHRDRELNNLIGELGRVAHLLDKGRRDNGCPVDVVIDAIRAIDDAAAELIAVRG
jgi:hypothetical protein